MAGKVTLSLLRLNNDAAAANNYYTEADNAGAIAIYRGNPGSGTAVAKLTDKGIVNLTGPTIIAAGHYNCSGGSVVARASFNIASVVRVSAGLWTVTMSNAAKNANYLVVGMASGVNGVQSDHILVREWSTPPTTTVFQLKAGNVASTLQDDISINFQVVELP